MTTTESPVRAPGNTARAATGGSTQSPGTHRQHMPALDGLRGLAILLVMFHHTVGELHASHAVTRFVSRLAMSGWVGVDLFFVLSGFLITGILLDTRGRPGYFRNFMVRRALRILPLYAVACVVVLAILPALGLLSAEEVAAPRRNLPWFVLLAPNILVALRGWESAGDLGHLWSIGIEEQFYLLWPLIVALAAPRRFVWVALGIALLAPALRVVGMVLGLPPIATYTLTPLHVDGLALGAFAATIQRWGAAPPWLARALTIAAILSGLALAVLFVRQGALGWGYRSMHLVGYSALAIVGCRAVIGAARARPDSRTERMLGHGPLRVLGKYSYSLYLFHQLVLAGVVALATRAGLLTDLASAGLARALLLLLVTTLGTLGVAMVTWRLIEQPALALKRYFPD